MGMYKQLANVKIDSKKDLIISEKAGDQIVMGQRKVFEDGSSTFLKNSITMSKETFQELKKVLNLINI